MGEYLGAFEFVCWSELVGCRVQMLIGAALTDLRDVFAPGLGPVPADAPTNVVVECLLGEGGELLTAKHQDSGVYRTKLNH